MRVKGELPLAWVCWEWLKGSCAGLDLVLKCAHSKPWAASAKGGCTFRDSQLPSEMSLSRALNPGPRVQNLWLLHPKENSAFLSVCYPAWCFFIALSLCNILLHIYLSTPLEEGFAYSPLESSTPITVIQTVTRDLAHAGSSINIYWMNEWRNE